MSKMLVYRNVGKDVYALPFKIASTLLCCT